MQRLGRAFALLQITGEILNDIEGFEHDHFKIIEQAYDSMVRNNKTIDKPKQLLEELLQYLDANRNNIVGDGYSSVKMVISKLYINVIIYVYWAKQSKRS